MSKSKSENDSKRSRKQRPFPACTLEEALELPNAIQTLASGQKVRRLTLFEQLNRSPDSSSSRMLIVNSNRYGFTQGSYSADFLELTPEGLKASSPDTLPREKKRVLFELAFTQIEPFRTLHEKFCDNRLPSKAVLEDALREAGVEDEFVSEGVETFIVNAKYLGLLRAFAGAERLVTIEQALDELPTSPLAISQAPAVVNAGPSSATIEGAPDWQSICFYISPIGDEASEQRKHADLFLGSIVEPALDEFKLRVVRADKIGEPGIITRQILEHILRSRLVVADLSFHNPNVFYELCLRHAARLPVVQFIRAGERIPFDLNQSRTITIDTTDIFSFVPRIESYRAELATQARRALENPDAVDNPISTYYPNARLAF